MSMWKRIEAGKKLANELGISLDEALKKIDCMCAEARGHSEVGCEEYEKNYFGQKTEGN